jgi:hypothetical protein
VSAIATNGTGPLQNDLEPGTVVWGLIPPEGTVLHLE